MLRTLTIILSGLLLSACMVGPDYKEPRKNIANHWLQTSHSSVKETPIQDASWWETFCDPTLTTLIYQGYQNNLTAQIAGVRVLQTRAQLAQSVGQLYPQQQALVGNYTYYKIGGGQLATLLPPDFVAASLGFTSSWEIDFWGKYRRAIQSNDATFLASFAAYNNALVSLTSDIASSYIAIRTYQALIKVTEQNIQVQRTSLAIAESHYRNGQTSLQDVEQAKTELSETLATLPGYISNLQHQKDLLGVLLGTTPDQVDPLLVKSRGIPKAPSKVAVGIPREAMLQRPDVHQAQLEAIAQSASIGAIKANLYPAFSLAGTFSFSSTNIGNSSVGDLFHRSNETINAGPSFTWPILNYGQITNAVRAQDAAFEQALLKYENVVLQAQQEVQDNITRYIEAQKAERSLAAANRSATESTKIVLVRYKQGETDYTTVLDVERQQLRVQTSLTNAKGEVSQSLVALYRALGGGWQIRDGNDVVPIAIENDMGARTNWGNLLTPQNHKPPQTQGENIKQLFLPSW
ncbi:MAG TPA: efflux transporter outer membrane subunit [Gammaproteobacteria bacterium]|nr:efflux transporter outer membrane subunit [Gammaproteobacteria bacterium]